MAMLVHQMVSYPCMVYILPVWHTLSTQPCVFSTGKKNSFHVERRSDVATLRPGSRGIRASEANMDSNQMDVSQNFLEAKKKKLWAL